jgi:hypothetical protein
MLFALLACHLSAPARAQVASASDTDLVETLLVQRFAAEAAKDARWSTEVGRLVRERDAIMKARVQEARRAARMEIALKASRLTVREREAEIAELQAAILSKDAAYNAALAQNREMLVEIARRDREWESRISLYRASLTSFIREASPEKKALLRRFAAGDTAGAYPLLVELSALEHDADLAAAEKTVADLQLAVRRRFIEEQRLLGILALEPLAKRELKVEEVLKPWLKIVASGQGERADYLMLANLWHLAADDVEAARVRSSASALRTGAETTSAFPLLAFVEASARPGLKSQWRSLAELARNPKPPIALPGYESIGQPATPLALDFVPVLESLASCEETMRELQRWTVESETFQLAKDAQAIGLPMPQGEAPSSERPTTTCNVATADMARLFSAGREEPFMDAMVLSAAALAASVSAVDGDAAVAMASATAPYCGGTNRRGRRLRPIGRAACALLSLVGASAAVAKDPKGASRNARKTLASLSDLDPAAMPAPDVAWIVPMTYQVGALVLEEAGDTAGAQATAKRGSDIGKAMIDQWTATPIDTIRYLELLVAEAGVQAPPGDAARKAAASRRASAALKAFLAAHPRSFFACELLEQFLDEQVGRALPAAPAEAFATFHGWRAELQRCGATWTEFRTLSGIKVSRDVEEYRYGNEYYYRIARTAERGGDVPTAAAAWNALLNNLHIPADRPATSLNLGYYVGAARSLGRLELVGGRRKEALSHFRKVAAVAKVNRARFLSVEALDQIAALAPDLGDAGEAARANVEKLEICATFVDPTLEESRENDLKTMSEDLIISIRCFGMPQAELVAARQLIDGRIAALQSATDAGTTTDRSAALAKAFLVLGTALHMNYEWDAAAAAYEQGLAALCGSGAACDAQGDLPSLLLFRRAELPKGDYWWVALRDRLTRKQAREPLSADEKRLLARAVARRPGQ